MLHKYYNKEKSINLPVVLCGYGSWSLTMKELQSLKRSEKRVLNSMKMPRKQEEGKRWRKLRNEIIIRELLQHYESNQNRNET